MFLCIETFHFRRQFHFIVCGIEFRDLTDAHCPFFHRGPEILYRISDRRHCSKPCYNYSSFHGYLHLFYVLPRNDPFCASPRAYAEYRKNAASGRTWLPSFLYLV